MSLLGVIARTFFKEVAWYKIVQFDRTAIVNSTEWDPRIVVVEQQDVRRAKCPVMRKQEWYGGYGTQLYALIEDSEIVGLCCYWFGDRYRTRDFWPLKDGEAKLVQAIVSPKVRGKGIGTALFMQSAAAMVRQGFETVYGRVWFSNKPSLRALEKAGWRQVAQVVEFQAHGTSKSRKFIFGRRET
jgi:RimJ/RimL family protein N-acetyltransferase